MKRYSYTLESINRIVGGVIRGNSQKLITGINSLPAACSDEISFLNNASYLQYLNSTKAGAVLLTAEDGINYKGDVIIVINPYLAYAKISHLFDPTLELERNIHKSAIIAPDVVIGENCAIGAGVIIENNVILGDNVVLESGVVIGRDSKIGNDTKIHRNATINHGVYIGNRVIIHSGAVIGDDGFGNVKDNDGQWIKITQLGGVIIEDDVEIGSNTCIDRGTLGNTIIHAGVRLDNLVQIAHNVSVGENTAIAACAGVAGSTRIGKNCMIGGATGITGHVEISDSVYLNGMSMVTSSLSQSGQYSSGTGLMNASTWRKNTVRFRKLDQLFKRVKSIEVQLGNHKKIAEVKS